jgi:hypothetical protein
MAACVASWKAFWFIQTTVIHILFQKPYILLFIAIFRAIISDRKKYNNNSLQVGTQQVLLNLVCDLAAQDRGPGFVASPEVTVFRPILTSVSYC